MSMNEWERLPAAIFLQICCIIPIKSFAPGWSLRARAILLGSWLLMLFTGWALSTLAG